MRRRVPVPGRPGTGEALLMDHDLQVCERVLYEASRMQDCTVLSSGRIPLIDSNAARIVELAGPSWRIAAVTSYPQNWRTDRLMEIPPPYAQGFWRAGMTLAVAG